MTASPGFEEQLVAEMRACRVCRDRPTGVPLAHQPRPIFVVSRQARILIASQAPGMRAHVSGIPFQDPSGVRLRNWLGVNEKQFYDPRNFAILPMGFCFPGHDAQGGDLPPRRECAPLWREQALSLLTNIHLVLLIGSHAQKYHLTDRRSMTETVRDWRESLAADNGRVTLPSPHPSWRNTAWLKRNLWFEEELLPVLRARVAKMLTSVD